MCLVDLFSYSILCYNSHFSSINSYFYTASYFKYSISSMPNLWPNLWHFYKGATKKYSSLLNPCFVLFNRSTVMLHFPPNFLPTYLIFCDCLFTLHTVPILKSTNANKEENYFSMFPFFYTLIGVSYSSRENISIYSLTGIRQNLTEHFVFSYSSVSFLFSLSMYHWGSLIYEFWYSLKRSFRRYTNKYAVSSE